MVVMAGLLLVLVVSAPSDVDRVSRLGAAIMCPVCQGESIADSPSPMARDMMDLIEERVGAGATDEQVVEEILASFTGAVLLDPPVTGPTIVLWLAPVAALLAGIAVIWWWRRQPAVTRGSQSGAPTKGRQAVGALIRIAALAAIVVTAGFFLQEREGANSGVAAVDVESLDSVSNETMEAVIAANLDNPAIDGMRLALAERYFTAGDYRSAFPHYLSVAESSLAEEAQVVTALIGLGWMAWDGNAEAETAIGLLDQALAIDANSVTARYLKGQVLWCGTESPDAAAELLVTILDDPGLAEATRAQIDQDLSSIEAGEPCS
jgi:cytochrome c-type biogenesis protein CcmH/NrfF